ncbi:Uncharacterised protein [Pseudomonas aeruginosa]|nr:Uncharacterised protein [Pseudomonas aeruginosa]
MLEVSYMKVFVRQHDQERMSREFKGVGADLWEVYQGDVLVGVYQSESEAIKYKECLEKQSEESQENNCI